MLFETNANRGPVPIPLQGAVLCSDCEMVSDNAYDKCPVCGSRSLLGLALVLGGTLRSQKAYPRTKYSLELTIKVHEIAAQNLNEVVAAMTRLSGTDGSGVWECLHIQVESADEGEPKSLLRAA
jgi:hypothetical protein